MEERRQAQERRAQLSTWHRPTQQSKTDAERNCGAGPPARAGPPGPAVLSKNQASSVYSNSYECFPSSTLIVILPASPSNSPLPESGTTVTDSCPSPRVIVPLC